MGFDVVCEEKENVLFTRARVQVSLPVIEEDEEEITPENSLVCLFDTGSSYTYVDKSYLEDIMAEKLPDRKQMKTMNGNILADQYIVDIYLPNRTTIKRQVVCASDVNIGVIIGMDIIKKGKLTLYQENGQSKIRFSLERLPSSYKPAVV